MLLGYPVYPDQVRGRKFERSQPFRAAAEAGNVKLLRGGWNEAFLEECEQFSPDEREYEHDDQIDATCGAFNYLTAPQKLEYIPVHTPSWANDTPTTTMTTDRTSRAVGDSRGVAAGRLGLTLLRAVTPLM